MKNLKLNKIILLVAIFAMALLPTAVFAEEYSYANYVSTIKSTSVTSTPMALESEIFVQATPQEMFITSRDLITRTFPTNTPHNLNTNEWWRMVQLATINEAVPGPNFNPPVFSSVDTITVENIQDIAPIIISMVAMGENPRNFNGRNLVMELVSAVNNYTADVIPSNSPWAMPPVFYAITATNAVGEVSPHVIDTLLSLQGSDGGWDQFGFGSGIEETAQLILILEPFSVLDPRIAPGLLKAREFLISWQMPNGGFPQGTWAPDTFGVETTARVIEAISALGECPLTWTVNGQITNTPIHGLINAMSPSGGFPGAMYFQAHIALGMSGLRVNPFTNLRNPVAFPNIQIPIGPYAPPVVPDTGGGTGGGGGNANQTAFITVSDPGGQGYMFNGYLVLEATNTAYTLLRRTGLQVGSSSSMIGVYVYEINGLREFDHGPDSGWMFTVNGVFPGRDANSAIVNSGDRVEWLFTRELGDDIGGGLQPEDSTPDSGQPGFTYDYDIPSVSAEVEANIDNGVAIAEISNELIESVVATALEENAENIVISIVDTGNATNINVGLNTQGIEYILQNNLTLTVNSNIAVVNFDINSLAGIISNTNLNQPVVLSIEAINENTNLSAAQKEVVGQNFGVSLNLLVGEEVVSQFEGFISISIPYSATSGSYINVFHVNYYGSVSEMYNSVYANGFVTFTTTHFSVFFINETLAEETLLNETGMLEIYEYEVDFETVTQETERLFFAILRRR